MLMVKVWPFVFIAVLVAPATSTNGDSGHRSEWLRVRRIFFGNRPTPPPAPPFFVGGKRPEGLPRSGLDSVIEIEQRYPDIGSKIYFVTLFDKERNIPLYSAYKVTADEAKGIGRSGVSRKNKTDWRNPTFPDPPNLYDAYKEAIETDRQPLSKGHMNPSGLNSFDINALRATYTLTNAAPQFKNFNSHPWRKFERKIVEYARRCSKLDDSAILYLLTGTSDYSIRPDKDNKPMRDTGIPFPDIKNRYLNGKVRLDTPRAMWTAGCCVWSLFGQRQHPQAASFAVMGNNQNNLDMVHQMQMKVTDLETLLREAGFWKPKVNLFPGNKNCGFKENDIRVQKWFLKGNNDFSLRENNNTFI